MNQNQNVFNFAQFQNDNPQADAINGGYTNPLEAAKPGAIPNVTPDIWASIQAGADPSAKANPAVGQGLNNIKTFSQQMGNNQPSSGNISGTTPYTSPITNQDGSTHAGGSTPIPSDYGSDALNASTGSNSSYSSMPTQTTQQIITQMMGDKLAKRGLYSIDSGSQITPEQYQQQVGQADNQYQTLINQTAQKEYYGQRLGLDSVGGNTSYNYQSSDNPKGRVFSPESNEFDASVAELMDTGINPISKSNLLLNRRVQTAANALSQSLGLGNFNPALAKGDNTANIKSLTQQTTRLNTIQAATNVANDNFDSLSQFMKDNHINKSNIPILNRAGLFIGGQLSDPAAVDTYRSSIATLQNEYAKVLSGNATPTVNDKSIS